MTDETQTPNKEPLANCEKHGFFSHLRECPYCKEEACAKAINIAVDVIRKASIGDQNFIACLRGDDPNTTALRHAIVELGDALRDT